MGSVTDKLDYLADTKEAIKNAIEAKGVEITSTATFRSYADSIGEIQGEAGYEIDTSKVDYSIGSNINAKTNNGRILQGFANMVGYHTRPLDASGDWLDVDWSKSFEICTTFKLTAYPSASAFHFIFGCGLSSTVYRFYSPSIIFYGSDYDYKMAVQIGATSSSWLVTDMVDYVPSLDTWYSIRLKFNSATMAFTIDITTDFNVWTNIYNNTLSATPYHNSASLCFGGDCQDSARSSNNLLIDTYNTYIKDDSGKIIWGAFAKSFDDGKYPIISGEYQLYDYIESDGTQYIDTGRKVVQGQTVKTVFHPLNNQPSYAWLFGAGDTSHYYGYQFPQQTTLLEYNGSTSSSGQMSVNTADEYVYSLTFTVSSSLDLSYYIFGFHYSETPGGSNIGKFRLYSISINGDYFLPCKRKTDGVFGLYDVANKIFLTNSASGNPFVGGNPVGNFDVFPKKDLSKYSITVKAKEIFATGGSSVYTTKTYTFDEDGFYFVGFSGWNNGSDGNNTSLTYSGEYTEYFTATSNKALKSSIVYAKAGTIVTMYIFGRYLSSYAIYKINGVSAIGNKLKEFTDVSPQLLKMSFDDIVSNKVLACVYYTEGSKDGQNANLYLDFIPKAMDEPINLNHTTVIYNDPYPNSGSGYTDWRDRVGIFFFEASSIGTVVSNIAGFGTRLFQVFEIE